MFTPLIINYLQMSKTLIGNGLETSCLRQRFRNFLSASFCFVSICQISDAKVIIFLEITK